MLHRHSYWPEPLDLVALAALRGTYDASRCGIEPTAADALANWITPE
jgi:hypothetical protein